MMRRGRGALGYGLLGLVVVTAVLMVHFLGVSFYVITGGSMTGAIPKGALAVERRVPTSGLEVGDIITFRPPNYSGVVTHRIVAISSDQSGRPVYQTKGDANTAADPWQFTLDHPQQAKFLVAVPGLGYALAFFTLRTVRTVMLACVGVAMIVMVLLWFRRTSGKPGDDRTPSAAAKTTAG